MLEIASEQNETYGRLLSLTTAKGIREQHMFLLSGEKLVREFVAKPTGKIAFEITSPAQDKRLAEHGRHVQLAPDLFKKVDVVGTKFNLLALELPVLGSITAEALNEYSPQGLEVITPMGDPGNLGALLRSCEAFGVPRVITTRECAFPFLPKAVKASAGSVLRLPMVRGPGLDECPRDSIALSLDGDPINTFSWPSKGFLVVGEEGKGLGAHAKKFKHRLRIPTQGVESLNAVVAASIALAYWAAQR